jgi:hypothetical protein
MMLATLMREQEAPPAAAATPPPATPPQTAGSQPGQVAPPPAQQAGPSSTPADALVQKDFVAFKSELKNLESQKTSIVAKWESAIKKKVGGKKVKLLASKAQHFQPASEYTIDVSDVKIGWHYDKTTSEVVYDLILIDGDKKYFMKPQQSQPLPGADAQPAAGEPETTEAPKTPEAPPVAPDASANPSDDAPPTEEPSAPEPPAADAPPAPDAAPPVPPTAAPEPTEPEDPAVAAAKKKKLAVRESSLLNDESYAVNEIIKDVKSIIEEVTGRSNIKPYLVGAGKRKNSTTTFELNIPKSHLREGVNGEDIALSFKINNMTARITEDYKGNVYHVRIEKYERQ